MPKGVIQDWGLVEYFDHEDTEATHVALNGHIIRGHSIRLHYCIPGVNAINIYMQVPTSSNQNNTLMKLKSNICIMFRLDKVLYA